MEFLKDLTKLRKEVDKLSDNFSGKKFAEWTVGITSDAQKAQSSGASAKVIECELESYSEIIAEQLQREGVQKDSNSSSGKFLYLYKK